MIRAAVVAHRLAHADEEALAQHRDAVASSWPAIDSNLRSVTLMSEAAWPKGQR